jgi:hypothetical protein
LTYEEFKNAAAALQSIAVASAVIAGGIWTLYTFGALQSTEQAAAQLTSSLNFSIETAQVEPLNPNNFRGLIVRVKAENLGSRHVTLTLHNTSLKVFAVQSDQEGGLSGSRKYMALRYVDLEPGRPIANASQGVQPKSFRYLNYYLDIPKPGLYFVSLSVPVDAESSATIGAGDWFATAFVDVR